MLEEGIMKCKLRMEALDIFSIHSLKEEQLISVSMKIMRFVKVVMIIHSSAFEDGKWNFSLLMFFDACVKCYLHV